MDLKPSAISASFHFFLESEVLVTSTETGSEERKKHKCEEQHEQCFISLLVL